MDKLENLHSSSKVWLYHSDRVFTDDESREIKIRIKEFTQSWISHNQALKAHGDLLYNRFAVLIVDESHAGASGCSIDTFAWLLFLRQDWLYA